ncbi:MULTISPECIES: type III secretion system cytoplasmic ring protein SctQ [unclassified Achromobacter]|uniref:type III secretion system cytoplasmic ring protein SctQ n=1 Tax=unclassified Achromobacter TaxID=2626865 RepID=UPI000B51BDA3|nr:MULTISPECIES: type III secretion system cytoplasmic ring protein SctQ [unclassified Achromobacter]OWT72720.1 hypothetical protein CEY05_22690 [Achromobacter sp. HZ34]OWT73939.1 hypothetical protein CEY04_21515 [Achromobacter sp. HZ28]
MSPHVPAVRPYPLPRLAAASVAAYNALARYGKQLDWPALDGRDGRWRLSIGMAPVSDAAHAPALRLRADGADVRLAVAPAALAAWLEAAFAGVGRVDLDQCGWVTDAAVECLIDFLRPRLRVLGLPAGWQLGRDDRQASSSADIAWRGSVLLAAPAAQDAWTLALQADAGGLALLARCLPRQAVTGDDVWLDDVPIPMRAMLGYTDLTYGDVHRLNAGDVVLLDQELGGSRGEICLRAPDGRALRLAAVTPDVAGDRAGMPAPYLIVADWISIMSPEEKEHYPEDDGSLDFDASHVSDDDDAVYEDDDGHGAGHDDEAAGHVLADQAGSDAMDAIPMRVGFDLGARAMPLGDVRRLRQGQTVVLDCEVGTAPVSIRANGLCIGHGELVEIDGRLGVRIVSLRQKRA